MRLHFDFLSNATGVDWPDKEIAEKVKVTRTVTKTVDGVEQPIEETVEETRKRVEPGCLEAVYHLFSVANKHGPVVIRMRTSTAPIRSNLPSLTPIWRSAEFQEREIFDLYGIVFTGHPDLRRLLMWDGFKDHPMRRDYVEPDDFEYEPTAARRSARSRPGPPRQRGTQEGRRNDDADGNAARSESSKAGTARRH